MQHEASVDPRMLAQRSARCFGKGADCLACRRLDDSALGRQKRYRRLGPISEVLFRGSSFGEQLCICWKICALGMQPWLCHDEAARLLMIHSLPAKADSTVSRRVCNQETGLSSSLASTMQEGQSMGLPARLVTRVEQTALARVMRLAPWSSSEFLHQTPNYLV